MSELSLWKSGNALHPKDVASHLLISIDPGKNTCGIAVWGCGADGAELLYACSFSARNTNKEYPVFVEDLWFEFLDGYADSPPVFFFEVPQYYAKKRNTFRGVDALMDVINAFRKYGICTDNLVYPRQWKGNVPKAVHQKRIQAALTPSEMLRISEEGSHDMWDAIGVGLFATGRTGRGATPYN